MRIDFKHWLYSGCDYAIHPAEKRKILNLNLAALIAFISISLYSVIYLATGNIALRTATYIHLPFTLFFLSVPWLTSQGWVNVARWAYSLALPTVIFLVILFVEGDLLDVHYYFILTGLVPVMLFPLSNWRAMLGLYMINIGLFVYVEQGLIEPTPALLTLDTWFITAMRLFFKYTGLLTLLLVILLSEFAAERNETQLEALSNTDKLTGLLNRRGLERYFEDALAHCRRATGCCAFLILDMDNFKPLNDLYGHDAGDILLKEVAMRITRALRATDVVARLGGDEFVILLPLGANREKAVRHALKIAEKIRLSLAATYSIAVKKGHASDYVTHQCSSSIGATIFSFGANWVDVFKQADTAMYQSKTQGRNRVSLFEENA